MAISLKLLVQIAQDALDQAEQAADTIRLSLNTAEKFTEALQCARAGRRPIAEKSLLSDRPEYGTLTNGWGAKAYGALLSFDLRKSSLLATQVSPRNMYLIMHTYMTTCMAVLKQAEGAIVGLRGDGAIAAFGLIYQGAEEKSVTGEQAEHAVREACKCGDAIVKAVQLVVNPLLAKKELRRGRNMVGVGEGALRVGVGIDVGDIVATRIGFEEVNELTIYGVPINHCCKRSFGNDMVILTKNAKDMFPKSDTGKTRLNPYPDIPDAYILRYPPDYKTVA